MIAVSAASYLPPGSVAVADLPELATLTAREMAVAAALGVDRVSADDGIGATELAVRAGRRALADAGLEPADIDVLVTVESRAPDTLVSSESTRLQKALGTERAMAFSVGGLGCASITPALLTARGLLAADPDIARILVVHGSKPATRRRYRHPVTVNGDSGGALVVSRQGPIRVRDILLETNGAYSDLFQVPYRDRVYDQWEESCTDLPGYSFRLAVETRNRLRALTARLLDRNGLRQDDLSCCISQNLSIGAFRSYEDALGVTIAKSCFGNLARYGHLGPNDIFFNLSSAISQGELPAGGHALALNVSPAAGWSVLLIDVGSGSRAHHLYLLSRTTVVLAPAGHRAGPGIQLTSYRGSSGAPRAPRSSRVSIRKCPVMPSAWHPTSQSAHQIPSATGA
jgi:3-oxoacyl-[acyl-carrier-protein] synthase III